MTDLKSIIKKSISAILIMATILISGCGLAGLSERQKGWIKDIDKDLRAGLASAAGVEQYVSKSDRNKRLDNIIKRIKTEDIDDKIIYYELCELISDIGVAHITLDKTMDFYTSEDCFYLLGGQWFGDEYRIVTTSEEYKNLLGGKIVAINGVPLDEVLSRYDRIYSNETQSFLKAMFEMENSYGLLASDLKYLGIIEDENDVVFEIELDGEIIEQKITPVSFDDLWNFYPANLYDEIPKLPYCNQIDKESENANFTYDLDEENRAFYFKYNACSDAFTTGDEGLPYFDKFFDKMIREMQNHEKEFDCFVIDLRSNMGGSELLWDKAVDKYKYYLQAFPIKILMGRYTFSAAVDVIDTSLYIWKDVTLYGSETGLAVENYTDTMPVELTNTGYTLWVTDHIDYNYVLNDMVKDVKRGVMPDVEVEQTYEDFINGVDTVYLRAVND